MATECMMSIMWVKALYQCVYVTYLALPHERTVPFMGRPVTNNNKNRPRSNELGPSSNETDLTKKGLGRTQRQQPRANLALPTASSTSNATLTEQYKIEVRQADFGLEKVILGQQRSSGALPKRTA